jgi:hypothetical protein
MYLLTNIYVWNISDKNPLWVGATDFGNGHVFTFTDGSKITVDPSKGQDLKTSNCLYVFGGTYEGFGPCPDLHGFICERSSTIRAWLKLD